MRARRVHGCIWVQTIGVYLLAVQPCSLAWRRLAAQDGLSVPVFCILQLYRQGRTDVPRQIITTANAPSSPFYSQGVRAGPHVLVSGIVGIDPSTGSLAGDTIQDQTRQALTNCQAILQAGGASLEDVVEVGILLTSPADFAGLNEEYARWFPSEPPTRYVAKLGVEMPGLLVSIRMTAFTT